MSSPGQETRREFVVAQRGVGRPDFSEEIYRANVAAGYPLQENEVFKYFGVTMNPIASPFAWIGPVLAINEVRSLIDLTTGLPMPYTVPEGYSLRFLSDLWSFSRRLETRAYLYGFFYGSGYPDSLNSYYYNIIGGFNSAMIDPNFNAIPYELQIVNPSSSVTASGSWVGTYVLRAENTPPLPETKTVKCKYCPHTEEMKRTDVKLVCPKCGQTTLYFGETLKNVRLTTMQRETK